MIPPIYCINLTRGVERREKAIKRFDKLNLNYKFYSGFDGHAIQVTTKFPYEEDHPGTNYFIGPCTIGLTLSHLGLLKAMETLGQEEFIILEDDCYFPDNFVEEFEKSYAALPPDWQIVYLGYCCVHDKQINKINDRVSIINFPFCSHAIMYKRTVIPRIMRDCCLLWAPWDIQLIKKVLPHVSTYCFTPSLAGQFTAEGKEIE